MRYLGRLLLATGAACGVTTGVFLAGLTFSAIGKVIKGGKSEHLYKAVLQTDCRVSHLDEVIDGKVYISGAIFDLAGLCTITNPTSFTWYDIEIYDGNALIGMWLMMEPGVRFEIYGSATKVLFKAVDYNGCIIRGCSQGEVEI